MIIIVVVAVVVVVVFEWQWRLVPKQFVLLWSCKALRCKASSWQSQDRLS